MPSYVNVSGTWQELTGTDQPYVKVSGTWQGVKNIYARASGVWQTVYEYDITGPTFSPSAPTVSPSGSSWIVTWPAINDAGSGVASATLYQLFAGSSSGLVAGSSYVITSPGFGGGSTTFTVPSNRRNTPGGETWTVGYYVIATDNAGNSSQSTASTVRYTRPLGSYVIAPDTSRSYDYNYPRWFPTSFTDPLDVRAGDSGLPSNYAGLYFYGTKLSDACLGFEPDDAVMFAQRKGSNGYSGTYRFAPCSDGTQPAGAPNINVYDVVDVGGVTWNNTDSFANIPIINFVTNISSGSIGSIAIITAGSSTTYRQLYPANAGALSYGGKVTLTFN